MRFLTWSWPHERQGAHRRRLNVNRCERPSGSCGKRVAIFPNTENCSEHSFGSVAKTSTSARHHHATHSPYRTIDAAIVFSDILTPLPALGYEVEYGGGIRIDPFSFDDVDDWTDFSARKHAPWAADALRAIGEDHTDIARLGFAGCPWTTTMYLLAGGTGDKEFQNTRAKVFSNPEAAQRVLMRVADAVGDLLADQVNHGGADAVQLFDTWAGLLSVENYRQTVLPATQRAIRVFREKPNARCR